MCRFCCRAIPSKVFRRDLCSPSFIEIQSFTVTVKLSSGNKNVYGQTDRGNTNIRPLLQGTYNNLKLCLINVNDFVKICFVFQDAWIKFRHVQKEITTHTCIINMGKHQVGAKLADYIKLALITIKLNYVYHEVLVVLRVVFRILILLITVIHV